MTRVGTQQSRGVPRGWWPLLAVGGLYTLSAVIIAAWRADPASTSDFRDFWENAVHFRQSGEISDALGVHNYLPFFTIFMLPWGFLPLRLAAALFVLLSLVLFGVSAALIENLLADGWGRRPRPAMIAALLLMLPYVHTCAVLGNLGLLVLFLVVAAWFLVERGRDWAAGLTLGLAILIKLLPVVLLAFFAFQRRWRVVGAALAVTVVLGLGVPLMAIGGRETLAQHRAFYQRAVRDHSAFVTLTSDQPRKTLYSNNAVPMVLRRLLSPTDAAPGRPAGRLLVNVGNAAPGLRLATYGALMCILIGASVLVTLYRRPSWPPVSIAEGRRLRWQYGVWCGLMLLAAPLLWTHYLPLIYWPLALLTDAVERGRRVAHRVDRTALVALGLWLLAAVLLLWPAARAAGAQIVAVLAVWLAGLRHALRVAGD